MGIYRFSRPGRQSTAIVAAASIAIAVSLGCAPVAAESAAASAVTHDAPVVPIIEVRARSIGIGIELDGTLQAVRQSTVAAQVSGNVVQRLVQAGEAVRAGQALVRIDERDTQAGLARSDAAVAQARAQLADAQSAYDRSRQLVASGFVSQAAVDTAQARLGAARAAERQALAARSQAALARNFATVAAPYDGLVLATHIEAGDLAVPGRAVATVYAPQPMRAVVHVPASSQSAMRESSAVEVELPGGARVAPVTRDVLPGVDPVSQTVEFRLGLPQEAAEGLRPGQSVSVRFSQASGSRLVVPAAAILRRGELDAVYVARPQGFVLRAVRLGATHGDEGVEVLAGLAEGERIAADPVRAGLQGAKPSRSSAGTP